jgi:transcriptional regulator with GAF, ATPase, and Fis domain
MLSADRIKAILSSSLKVFEEPMGALNIYSCATETFDTKGQEAAAVLAQRTSVILSDAVLA